MLASKRGENDGKESWNSLAEAANQFEADTGSEGRKSAEVKSDEVRFVKKNEAMQNLPRSDFFGIVASKGGEMIKRKHQMVEQRSLS